MSTTASSPHDDRQPARPQRPTTVRKGAARQSTYLRFDHWLTSSRPHWRAGLLVEIVGVVAAALTVVLLPALMASWLYPSGWASEARTAWIDSMRMGVLGVIAFASIAAWVIQYRQAVLARAADEYPESIRNLSKSTREQAAPSLPLVAVAGGVTTALMVVALWRGAARAGRMARLAVEAGGRP